MVINHNIASMVSGNALYSANVSLGKSIQKLSTGLRINTSSYDAAGLSIAEKLHAQVIGLSQAGRNAQDGIAALQIADGAAGEISSIIQRMRELSVQSSSDTMSSTERAYSNQEFTELQSEINRIALATNYNGQTLLSNVAANRFGSGNGAASGSKLWIDANYTTGVDSITIAIDTLTVDANGISISLANMDVLTQAHATSMISTLDTALDSVNNARSKIGSYINRLEHAVNNLMVSETNQAAAESAMRDVDFSRETSNYTKSQILMQSATAMVAQANALPQNVLMLLKQL